MLELDDIQSGVLRPRPTPYAATYVLLRIDDRKAGRELMRRASAVVTSAANPTSPVARYLGERRAHLPGPQGARRAAGLARQLRVGVPAGDGRAREGAGRHRREQPGTLGKAARDAGRPRRARRGRAGRASGSKSALERARKAYRAAAGDHGDLAPGLPRAAHREGALRVQGRHQPSGDRRQRHSRAPTPGSSPSRRASSSSAIATRSAASRRCPGPRFWAATAPTWSSASCTSAWPRSAGI